MPQDEQLPEELTDCQRVLASLAPRSSRIDRDRLMIRLGEQSAARGSAPWKWATGASLLLAAVLGLRPAIDPQEAEPTQVAKQENPTVTETRLPGSSPGRTRAEAAPPAVRSIDKDADWLRALASGQLYGTGPLTVRPPMTSSALAQQTAEAPVADDSPDAIPPRRTPTLRWGDQLLHRDTFDLASPPAAS